MVHRKIIKMFYDLYANQRKIDAKVHYTHLLTL